MISVDPGLQGTAWAFWDLRKVGPPEVVGFLPREEDAVPWESRALHLGLQFHKILDQHWADVVLLEMPEFFEHAGGLTVARKGSLVKLTFLVGVLANVAFSAGCQVQYAYAGRWKGQTPKEVMISRVRKILGVQSTRFYRTHQWDAVALGLWWKGAFNGNGKSPKDH